MRKLSLTLAVLIAALSLVNAKAVTIADPASSTGFRTVIEYTDKYATNVRLSGPFTFYKDNDIRLLASGAVLSKGDSTSNYIYGPESWNQGGMRHIGTFYSIDMTESDGTWTLELELPSCAYLYSFTVSYDGGETWTNITDPDNEPEQNAYALNPQGASKFYVPFDSEKQSPEDDWTFLLPVEDSSKAGTIEYLEYKGADGGIRPAQVYLPAGYDASRDEPYKILVMSHGGGGSEGDWFHQGSVNNIADRLIADGKTEPFIIVTPENMSFALGANADYHAIHDDMVNYLFPVLKEKYNLSGNTKDWAMAGLSRGANVTSWILLRETGTFGSYALFSNGAVNLYSADSYNEYLGKVNIYLGAGFADHCLLRKDVLDITTSSSVIGFAWLLNNIGIEFNNGNPVKVVPGAHDWYTWPQLAYDYFLNYLWK